MKGWMGVRAGLAMVWTTSPVLTAASLLMTVALAAFLVGLLVDPRIITGAPAWLKPAKFAVSTTIYMLTLAWVFAQLPGWPRTRQVVGWITAVILVLEVAIIGTQAWRGTTSHFNIGTPLDAALFSIMGSAIVAQTLTSIAVAVALWRQQFADRALGWALRFGVLITILGASTGGLMVGPTAAQLDEARSTGRLTIAGAHTVGAPDGGPGLPGTGWSLGHGDLRIPHFVGLHAMQVLPFVALAVRRRRSLAAARVKLVAVSVASYAALFALLLWQALRGQSLVQPDTATIVALTAWAAATAFGAWIVRRRAAAGTHAIAIA